VGLAFWQLGVGARRLGALTDTDLIDTPYNTVSARSATVIRILVEALTSAVRLLERFGTGGMPADQIRKMLGRAPRLAAAFSGSPRDRAELVQGLVEKVIVDDKAIIVKIRPGALLGRDGRQENGGNVTGPRAADDFPMIRARMEELRRERTRPRAADYFATIRARMEELRHERAQLLRSRQCRYRQSRDAGRGTE
jgi:hypothetical protein